MDNNNTNYTSLVQGECFYDSSLNQGITDYNNFAAAVPESLRSDLFLVLVLEIVWVANFLMSMGFAVLLITRVKSGEKEEKGAGFLKTCCKFFCICLTFES